VLRALAVASATLLLAGAASGAPPKAFTFRPVASGLINADYVTTPPRDASTLYVVEQQGVIEKVRGGKDAGPFLDITDRVSFDGERGLLGLAFSPGYATSGLFYVDYTSADGVVHVVEMHAADGSGDPSTARELLAVQHPWPNHNGGQLVFDRAGRLLVGIGDGGTPPDQDTTLGDPMNHAQTLSSPLGKILRLDPSRPGTWQIGEVGLRNPWRFSFDRKTGDLWIGDVGAASWEEVDYRPAAQARTVADFGWSRWEGRESYNPTVKTRKPLVGPLYEYRHTAAGQCAIVGGYVYRGSLAPSARGKYFYGDYCTGRVGALTLTNGKASVRYVADGLAPLTSFGEDANGELYAVSATGDLYQLR
jgi:glucose/arabinose dehydrogenase